MAAHCWADMTSTIMQANSVSSGDLGHTEYGRLEWLFLSTTANKQFACIWYTSEVPGQCVSPVNDSKCCSHKPSNFGMQPFPSHALQLSLKITEKCSINLEVLI